MKKYIFMITVAALGLTSCSSDYLETKPQSATSTATILGTTDNAELIINGMCRLMTTQYLSVQGLNGEGVIKTWYGNWPGNDFQKCNLTGWAPIMNSTFHENVDAVYLYYPWFYYYKQVSNANAVICNVDNAEGTESDRQFLKAQALTFRAHAFLMLSQLYCYRWQDSSNGASDGIILRIDESTGDQPLATLAETYQQIYADLDEAISLYQQSGRDRKATEFYKPNLNVAYAVYARAALTREDWANAAKYAKLAREGHALMSNAEYFDGMHTPNSEWLWGVYEASDQTIYYYGFYAYQGSNATGSNGKNYPSAISKELIDQIPESDVRRDLYLVPTDEELAECNVAGRSTKKLYKRAYANYADRMDPKKGSLVFAYMQFKFLAEFEPGGGSFTIYRTGEMYYIEAEADCHLGKEAEAQQLLYEANKERDPQLVKTTKTGADLLAEVKLYRRFDLWGEGYDWYDYKRWNQPIVRHTWADGGSFHTTFAKTIAVDAENRWTWKIPRKETDYNGAFKSLPETQN